MALASIPLIAVTGNAHAEKSASRTALQYQDKPKEGKQCSDCLQFVPGKTPKDKGGCKIMPGDTEIAPTGWCAAFVAMPPKK
ncbi:MAG TPA: high-potential iron-sulfur protein [Usitatibacteraceae bacterium]